jgi:hypothetical protein
MEAGAPVKLPGHALGLFAVMLWALCSRGEAAPKAFANSAYGFKLVLSEDWDHLPPAAMNALNDTIAKAQRDWPRPALQAGFWMTNAPGFAFRPYTIIHVVEPGSTLDEKTIRSEWNERVLLPEGAELNDPVLDTNLNAFVANGQVMFQNDVAAVVSVAVFPTRLGAIKVLSFVARKDFENHPYLFAQVLKGVRIDEDYTVGWKPSKIGLWIGLASIGLILFTLWRAKPASSTA